MSKERYIQAQWRMIETGKAATSTTGKPESNRLTEQEQPQDIQEHGRLPFFPYYDCRACEITAQYKVQFKQMY